MMQNKGPAGRSRRAVSHGRNYSQPQTSIPISRRPPLSLRTSALADKAIVDDRRWITPIVRMEILYSARSATEHATPLRRNSTGSRSYAVTDAAMSALGELAQRSDRSHRLLLTDALIAAASAEHGGIAVLHRDTHFDKLAKALAFENVELPKS
jgi:predicted nucleic acid-binding protein